MLCPGEVLRDELHARGWTQAEFAGKIGRPAQMVSEIVSGKKTITARTAVEFSRVLGTSALFWMSLQAQYDIEFWRNKIGADQ